MYNKTLWILWAFHFRLPLVRLQHKTNINKKSLQGTNQWEGVKGHLRFRRSQQASVCPASESQLLQFFSLDDQPASLKWILESGEPCVCVCVCLDLRGVAWWAGKIWAEDRLRVNEAPMEVRERKEVRAVGVYWWSSETDSLKGECFFFLLSWEFHATLL